MNKIHLIGRVVHSPEVKTTKSGTKVCTFTLAVRRRFKDQSGEYQTDFFDVQAWRTLADLCEKYLEKGKMALVSGSMQSRTYEKDGVKRKVWELMADEVEFLADGKSAANPDQQQGKAVPKSNTNGFDPANQYTQADDEELPF
jgi:single-strand DNA-binding protein